MYLTLMHFTAESFNNMALTLWTYFSEFKKGLSSMEIKVTCEDLWEIGWETSIRT